MKTIGRESWWLLAAGILLILTAARDWVAPGFFSIARLHASTLDIALEPLTGVIFIVAALRKRTHPQRT
jgi:hypothetical protein